MQPFHKGQPDNSGVPIWKDKAGGYGIQEPFGIKAVSWIRGDYYNVVGLPLGRLCQELKKFDVFL